MVRACQEASRTAKRGLVRPHGSKGFTLIELLIVVAIIGILAAIAIPNVLSARRRANYARAATDTKQAVTQAVIYVNDNGVYPGDVATLRTEGYVSIDNQDPWGVNWVASPAFRDTEAPVNTSGEVHLCSEGPTGSSADCTDQEFEAPPQSTPAGGVGYSTTYGSWMGS